MAEIDLSFIAAQLDRVLAEQRDIRSELRYLRNEVHIIRGEMAIVRGSLGRLEDTISMDVLDRLRQLENARGS